jgi:hypothetical protein
MFTNLMIEVEAIRKARPDYGILEAIMFINDNEDEYDSVVIRELGVFLSQGRRLMATTNHPYMV